MERREFLHGMFASGLTAASASGQQTATPATISGSAADASKLLRASSPGERRGDMLYRKLGRTGETVSAIGLGGSHLAKANVTEAESKRLIHAAIDRGITFLDNSWDYNEGRSERWMGEALAE